MCDTTWWFRGNCSGKCKKCPFKCGYSFCEYHGAPVTTIATPVGGHVAILSCIKDVNEALR